MMKRTMILLVGLAWFGPWSAAVGQESQSADTDDRWDHEWSTIVDEIRPELDEAMRELHQAMPRIRRELRRTLRQMPEITDAMGEAIEFVGESLGHAMDSMSRSMVIASRPSAFMMGPIVPATFGQSREIDVTKAFTAGGDVQIENIAGRVEVIGWDREEIRVQGRLGEDVERLEFDVDDDDADIEVVIPNRRRTRNIRSDLTIHVPRQTSLEIETISAAIDVTGVHGENHEIETVSGSIKLVDTTGELDLESVSGSIDARDIADPIDAQAVSGSITITGASPSVSVETVSGGISVQSQGGELYAESISGQIDLETSRVHRAEFGTVSGGVRLHGSLADNGRLEAKTISGRIALDFKEDVNGRFDIVTHSGRIECEFGPEPSRISRYGPGRELIFDHGRGSARVDIETFSGSVIIRRVSR